MATRTRLTGFTRFLLAMIILVPAAIVFSLWYTGQEITVENITNPSTWNNNINPKDDVREDEKKPLRDLDDVKDNIKIRDLTKDEPAEQETVEENTEKPNIKDLVNNFDPKNNDQAAETDTDTQVDNNVIKPSNNPAVDELQARISRLKDDIKEKDTRIEKLYQENETLRKRHTAMTDSLSLIKGKLDKLKDALN